MSERLEHAQYGDVSREVICELFFEQARSRRELVVAFLSVLELVRTTDVNLVQEQTFGDIVVRVAS